MRLLRFVPAVLGLAAALGCAPTTAQPTRVMGLVLSNKGVLETRLLEVRSFTDAVAVQGHVASFIGGARVVVDPKDPMLQLNGGNLSDAQLAEALVKNRGAQPRANYIEKDGVLWPADFHTWNLVTAYFHFEKTYEYFQGIYDGKPTDELRSPKVYYFADFVLADQSPLPKKDNAAYFSPVQAFLILPFEEIEKVPLSINPGVIAHEYSHGVFNKRVYQGRSLPEPLNRWLGVGTSTPAVNLVKAVDEGLADFHAYGTSCLHESGCTPRWLGTSFEDSVTNDRDISAPNKCMTEPLRKAMNTLNIDDFSRGGMEYQVGTLLAAALYQAGIRASKMQVLQKSLLNAYTDKNPTTPGLQELITANLESPQNFTLGAVANVLLSHIPDDELRKLTCNEFLTRLQLRRDELPACPAASTAAHTCPSINP